MIIVRIREGLGNQMFQYATAYALARRLNQPLLLFHDEVYENRPFRLNLFNINETTIESNELPLNIKLIRNKYMNCVLRKLHIIKESRQDQYVQFQLGRWLYFSELQNGFQKPLLALNSGNIFLNGFFLSHSLFEKCRKDLLSSFIPSYPGETDFINTLNQIKGCNSVAVHVRRGDYRFSNHPYHYLLGEDYYRRAISYIRKKVETPVFFWFSEDFEWVHEHFRSEKDFRFIKLQTMHRDIDEMMLMKNCNHIITANSTFSWWAAWLNEHENPIRIIPEKRFGNEMVPDSWILLPIF